MKENEKDASAENKICEDEDNEDFLQIDNLNINQEVDIKENPKKHIVNTKKKHMLKNSLDDNCIDISENVSSIKQNRKNSKRHITYDDIYLGNEMLAVAPKSFPRDFEKNNKYLKKFTKMYNKSYSSNSHNSSISNSSNNSNSNSNNNSSSTNNNSNFSIDQEDEYEEEDIFLQRNNSYDYFGKKEESSHLKDFLASINSHRKNINENIINTDDNIYIDEDEKKNQNIYKYR